MRGPRLPNGPPPGPFRPAFWRSPLRGPWMTSVLGLLLLGPLLATTVTGFLSHTAYVPSLPGNAVIDPSRTLPTLFTWPAGPAWLYAVSQGVHVNAGLVAIPLLLAKLWSVIPRLFAFPPFRSPAELIERLLIGLLVSSGVFQLATGVLNMQSFYPFGFNFVVAHYYGAIVFSAAVVLHVAVKTPVVLRALWERDSLRLLKADLAHTEPEPAGIGHLAPTRPAAPTITRRGVLAFAGAGSLSLLAANVGASIGGPLRGTALLSPRRQVGGSGPNGFPVNKTAAGAGIRERMVGAGYRLELRGPTGTVRLDRAGLSAMPQRTATLPIACVEGWSTTQTWTGVPIADLAALVGAEAADSVLVESLQPAGVLRRASLTGEQMRAPRALLALQVNGADLSMDHGYPARIIVPALPGVHNTKWVGRMTFRPGGGASGPAAGDVPAGRAA